MDFSYIQMSRVFLFIWLLEMFNKWKENKIGRYTVMIGMVASKQVFFSWSTWTEYKYALLLYFQIYVFILFGFVVALCLNSSRFFWDNEDISTLTTLHNSDRYVENCNIRITFLALMEALWFLLWFPICEWKVKIGLQKAKKKCCTINLNSYWIRRALSVASNKQWPNILYTQHTQTQRNVPDRS